MGYISEHIKLFEVSKIDEDIVLILYQNVKDTCIELFENGYKNYLTDTDKIFSEDETTITAGIFDHIERIINDIDLPFFIVPEFHQYTSFIRKGEVNPNKAKRFDLHITHLQTKPRIKFGVEAKLIAVHNTVTRNATAMINEYVENAGMGKFINQIYDQSFFDEGFMLGYMLNGSSDGVVSKINFKISTTYSANEQLSKHKKHYISSYSIEEKRMELHHIFLDFTS